MVGFHFFNDNLKFHKAFIGYALRFIVDQISQSFCFVSIFFQQKIVDIKLVLIIFFGIFFKA